MSFAYLYEKPLTLGVKQGGGVLVLGFGPVSYFLLIIFTHTLEIHGIVCSPMATGGANTHFSVPAEFGFF